MIDYRPLRAADVDALFQLVTRSERHDRLPISTPREELVGIFDEPHFNPETDGVVAVNGPKLVGWGRVWHQPSGVRLERAYLVGSVDPTLRRCGIGSHIFAWLLDRARERLLKSGNELPRFVRTQAYEWQTDAIALYERHGLVAVRWFEELMRELNDLSSQDPPAGIEVIPWDHNRDLETLEVKNSAFADHWGSTPTSTEIWVKWLREYGTRLDLSFMAVDSGRVVGYAINEHFSEDQEINGRLDGWIGSLGVLTTHRKRGVASALIARSLHAFAEAGFSHALIGVDSENPSGAASLYRKLGFQPRSRSVTHELEV